jgi:hypothetical protein
MDERQDDKPEITREMIALYDDYTHVSLDRRRFMDSPRQGGGVDDRSRHHRRHDGRQR